MITLEIPLATVQTEIPSTIIPFITVALVEISILPIEMPVLTVGQIIFFPTPDRKHSGLMAGAGQRTAETEIFFMPEAAVRLLLRMAAV